MKKKILVIGNYGIEGKLNGQTARTRSVTQSIEKKYGKIYVKRINTQSFNLLTILETIYYIIISKKIVIMPAQKSLKPIVKLINILKASGKTVYVAIGGWLNDFVEKSINLKKNLMNLKKILVQTNALKVSLEEKGLANIKVFPNYRQINEEIYFDEKDREKRKIVYYSRVREDKGIFIAIDAIKKINEEIALDVYGPIDEEFKEDFFKMIEKENNIKYCGILNGTDIVMTLSKYACMVFPTYYEGEGFPGAVLEAMMAGTPIIASDWKYNSEIIHNDVTGVILKENNSNCLAFAIKKFLNNEENRVHMSKNCIKEAQKYKEENVFPILYETLEIETEEI